MKIWVWGLGKVDMLLYYFQVLRSIPFGKVDIKLISVEIKREKFDDKVGGTHFDPYNDIVQFLHTNGYTLLRLIQHTNENKTCEAFFHKDR